MSNTGLKKFLILRFSSLGDIVMGTPMIRCLRKAYPAAQIDMVVRKDFLDLIRHNPHLNEKIGLPRGSGMAGLAHLKEKMNEARYDLIYDAHRSLRTRYLMPLLRAPEKAYFEKHYFRRSLALTFKIPTYKNMPRMIENYISPLGPYGVAFDQRGPEIFVPDDIKQRLAAQFNLGQSRKKIIGIIPSAQWPGKRWPLPYFRALIQKLVHESSNRIIVFGGREDIFCEALCEGLPTDRVINVQGKLSILESAALVSFCSLVVANDTGLMHVADALDIPSVLLLGPTSKDLGCLPFHPQTIIHEHDLWCRPCSKNGQAPCIRGRRVCLERTLPDQVVASTLHLVDQRPEFPL